MSKQRNIRKKASSEEPEDTPDVAGDPECQRGKLAETRLMQQLRRRAAGTGAASLAMGLAGPGIGPGGGGDAGGSGRAGSAEPRSAADDAAASDGGGPVMDSYVKAKSIATQQDEDAHMQKYIEEQLALRLGKSAAQAAAEEDELDPEAKRRKIEAELYAVPADFKNSLEQEVVLPGLVSTLSEVPLSARDKLASIEATEALKRKLLARVGAGTLVLEEVEEARERDAAKIRRGQFVKQFGRAPPKRNLTPEELEAEARRRKVISDRDWAPRGGGGGSGGPKGQRK